MIPSRTRAGSRAFDEQGDNVSADSPDGEIGEEPAVVDKAEEGGSIPQSFSEEEWREWHAQDTLKTKGG